MYWGTQLILGVGCNISIDGLLENEVLMVDFWDMVCGGLRSTTYTGCCESLGNCQYRFEVFRSQLYQIYKESRTITLAITVSRPLHNLSTHFMSGFIVHLILHNIHIPPLCFGMIFRNPFTTLHYSLGRYNSKP